MRAMAVLWALTTLSVASQAAQAAPQDEAQSIKSVLANCFASTFTTLPLASDPQSIPPGLIEGQNVHVVPIAGANDAYSYEGTVAGGGTCGIAVYGTLPISLQIEIKQLIDSNPNWKPHSPDAWEFDHVPAIESYWGDPLGPGLIGVVMLTRQPSKKAPTLEVEYHRVFVQ